MVTHIKGNIFVLIKTSPIIFQVSVDRFFKFLQVFEIINLSMKWAKKIGGSPCLVRGYCAIYHQNGRLLLIFRRETGASFTKLA